ncbi:MAG: nitrous oxide reductase family maturation protein NosD [Ectothiorhodospiraceae bacterium]|nr:nitrous oxide reductase family maturation protein NosD [Chromatiales bacterium]MCP5153617.1 nitrous oxide reductase family maturation protein NosD [Ectothiorhodospiraceae bacterium]
MGVVARAGRSLLLTLSLVSATAGGAEREVAPGDDALVRALAAAAPGDTLVLLPGDHAGPVVIDRPLTIEGRAGARIVGPGHGRVVTVDAPDVRLSGVTVTGSGLTLASEDSGVFVTARGERARIEANRLLGNLIGVNLKGPRDARVSDNRIEGRRDLRMNERGNGVQVWNAPGSVVADNDIRFGRDGIFVTTSRGNVFRGNRLSELRFAVHYMYTDDSEVSANVSRGNHIGYAIMFSHRIEVLGNVSDGDRDRGLLFNYANDSHIRGNRVLPAAEKCVFLYNANGNVLSGNRFEGCETGIHFTAGSEGNTIAGNAFVANRNQVKYVGTRVVEWSADGRGNYWSDNTDFDLNGDGIAERPYRPNDLVDHLVWRHPLARLLLASPAMHLLAAAQSQFPGLHPGGVRDSAPLMSPPPETRR